MNFPLFFGSLALLGIALFLLYQQARRVAK